MELASIATASDGRLRYFSAGTASLGCKAGLGEPVPVPVHPNLVTTMIGDHKIAPCFVNFVGPAPGWDDGPMLASRGVGA